MTYASLEELDQQLISPLNKAHGSDTYIYHSSKSTVKISRAIFMCSFNLVMDNSIKFKKLPNQNHSKEAHEAGRLKKLYDE